MRLTIRCMLFLAVLGAAAPEALAFTKVPFEVAKALKVQKGRPVDTGLVFIDGKFVKPPYRVNRYGTQITINGFPVTGPLASWDELLKTQDSVKVTEVEVEDVPAPAPAAKKAPAKPVEDGVDPAAPKDGGNAPQVDPNSKPSAAMDDLFSGVTVRIVETRVAADPDALEDFNPNAPETMKLSDIPADTEEDKARRKKLADEKKAEAEEEQAEAESAANGDATATDDSGEPLDPASPEGEAAAKKAAAEKAKAAPAVPKKMRKVYSLEGEFVMNNRAQKLMKPVNAARVKFESILRAGGYIFFSSHGRRVTGEALGSKKLLEKLPKMMRDAKDSESFCDNVRSAGLMTYMNYQNAQDLYRNKTDFAALMERQRAMKEAEKLKKLMNR